MIRDFRTPMRARTRVMEFHLAIPPTRTTDPNMPNPPREKCAPVNERVASYRKRHLARYDYYPSEDAGAVIVRLAQLKPGHAICAIIDHLIVTGGKAIFKEQ